ncbi:MAG: CGGC domain-containing protein [Desulfosalsimonadaceae bacterium]
MEKILIVGCKKTMDDVCIACSRCMVGFNRKVGEFSRYENQDAELVGILNCGDCPGAGIVTRLVQINLWNKPLDEKITKVHIANCLMDNCPHKEAVIAKIRNKAGVEVIEGTHPFIPQNIFV